jgi:hypothetical protein
LPGTNILASSITEENVFHLVQVRHVEVVGGVAAVVDGGQALLHHRRLVPTEEGGDVRLRLVATGHLQLRFVKTFLLPLKLRLGWVRLG